MKLGLEAIAFDVPKFYLELSDLAQARGIEPLKFTKGLGQKQMAVATPCEDTVTLAAGAASRLMERFDVDPASIGLVIVGTESSVDQSKPISVYLHHALGLSSRCRTLEVKHACYGTMAGLQIATDWISSGRNHGKKALIIASDIARYGAKTAGEPTQGAGAVALLISDQPRLLEFDADLQGYYSKHVMDFWRPNYSKEAVVDGHFSMQCYLDALTESYQMYREQALAAKSQPPAHSEGDFFASLYHAPFVKMAQKAHIRFLETQSGKPIAEKSAEWEEAMAHYAANVLPYLELNSRVGNIYTGSIYLSLFNLLEKIPVSAVGKTVSLFSYGSGCAAEWMSARLTDRGSIQDRMGSSEELLAKRTRLTVPEYEEILAAAGNADANGAEGCEPARWGVERKVMYLGTREHRRIYSGM